MRVTAEENGNGDLTVAVLAEALQGLPDDAVVHVSIGDSQHDGTYWSLKVHWDDAHEGALVNMRGFSTTGRAKNMTNPYNQGQWGDH